MVSDFCRSRNSNLRWEEGYNGGPSVLETLDDLEFLRQEGRHPAEGHWVAIVDRGSLATISILWFPGIWGSLSFWCGIEFLFNFNCARGFPSHVASLQPKPAELETVLHRESLLGSPQEWRARCSEGGHLDSGTYPRLRDIEAGGLLNP